MLLPVFALHRMALKGVDRAFTLGHKRSVTAQLRMRQAAPGLRAERHEQGDHPASSRSVWRGLRGWPRRSRPAQEGTTAFEPRHRPSAPEAAPKRSSGFRRIPASSRCARSSHSWPPVASKQATARRSQAIWSSCACPLPMYVSRRLRPSVRQWMSSESHETSSPTMAGCGRASIFSSFRFGVRMAAINRSR